MADSIKASFDITFENPFGIVPMAQQVMGLSHRISTAAFPPKAVGVAVGLRFRDGIEAEQVESLHGSIGHDGNPGGLAVGRCSWGCTPGGAVAVGNRAGAGC